MDESIESVYLRELIRQCEYAIGAVQKANEALSNQNPSEFFREAGDFLQHSSAVSRMLWPPGGINRQKKKKARQRGDHLRAQLSVQEGHVLQNRKLRDHFEHFDERLDEWAEASPNKIIVDNMVGPRKAIAGDAIKDEDIMRMYDPTNKEIVFRGEKFNVQTLVDGINDIQAKGVARLGAIEVNKRLQRIGYAGR
ncbi:MAG TPA: hypothetical protein VK138_15495 [Acidiferrobacterales bacterium]|nr:hypothetical protein [Acidiferrobacterales bacterium]